MLTVELAQRGRAGLGQPVRTLIIGRRLDAGHRLPSVRQLAGDLELAPGTVARVYRDLERDGYVTTSATGTTVADLGERSSREQQDLIHRMADNFAATAVRAGIDLETAVQALHGAYDRATADVTP